MRRADRIAALKATAAQRILVLDGSWGTMIQRRKLSESDFRGERFAGHPDPLQGDNDLLSITRPDVISDLHGQYFASVSEIS